MSAIYHEIISQNLAGKFTNFCKTINLIFFRKKKLKIMLFSPNCKVHRMRWTFNDSSSQTVAPSKWEKTPVSRFLFVISGLGGPERVLGGTYVTGWCRYRLYYTIFHTFEFDFSIISGENFGFFGHKWFCFLGVFLWWLHERILKNWQFEFILIIDPNIKIPIHFKVHTPK